MSGGLLTLSALLAVGGIDSSMENAIQGNLSIAAIIQFGTMLPFTFLIYQKLGWNIFTQFSLIVAMAVTCIVYLHGFLRTHPVR